MGGIIDGLGNLIGIGGGSSASGGAATGAVDAEADKAKAIRAKLLSTAGGVEGEEVLSGSTKKRTSLLGN